MKDFVQPLAEKIAKKTLANSPITIIICKYGHQINGHIIDFFHLMQGDMSKLADALQSALEEKDIRCEIKKNEGEQCDTLFVVQGNNTEWF